MSHDWDRDRFAAFLGYLRNRHTQLAVDERGPRLRGIAGSAETDDACEAAVAALDKMKAGFTARPPRRLFAGDQHAVPLADDPDGRGVDPGQIDGDLERVVGLVDVERRRALAREGFGAEGASELEKDLPGFLGKIADFGRKCDGVYARAHAR